MIPQAQRGVFLRQLGFWMVYVVKNMDLSSGIRYLIKSTEFGTADAATILSELYDELGRQPDLDKCRYWRKWAVE